MTGCASGIGKHLARRLVGDGHRVLATDVNADGLRSLEAECKGSPGILVTQVLDVTSREAWDSGMSTLRRRFGGVDVMLNIAGYLYPARIQGARPVDIDRHVDINVKGVVHGTCAAAALMMEEAKSKSDGGEFSARHIINFSSLGAMAPVSGVTLYLCAKYAVRGFSLSAAKDLARDDVHITCPDAVKTAMLDLQLHFEESAMAYSGAMLSVEDVERAVMDRVLLHRPTEAWIPASTVRGFGARFADMLHASRFINWSEALMRRQGEKEQAARLGGGGPTGSKLEEHWASKMDTK